jgi:hypothetical protein
MAVDPTNTSRLFVTYTDFDSSGVCGPSASRFAIELVSSTDGGVTWSAPAVIDDGCSPFSVSGLFDQGSQVAVGPRGEVYVAWEFFHADYFTRELRIRKSSNHGSSFGPSVKVSDVTAVGDGFTFQGGFRNNEFPMLAVDRSGTRTNGNVYIAWNDGRNLQIPNLVDNGLYGYADVLLSRSTTGGASWSAPVRVNTNPEPLPGGRRSDQFMPSVAVDNTGRVGACWYDRRKDPSNYAVDRFCGMSTDVGMTFTNTRVTVASWLPTLATEPVYAATYMGDYDGLASDATKAMPGFIGAFQIISTVGKTARSDVLVPNPDVFATVLR